MPPIRSTRACTELAGARVYPNDRSPQYHGLATVGFDAMADAHDDQRLQLLRLCRHELRVQVRAKQLEQIVSHEQSQARPQHGVILKHFVG